jgi:hypothetical protein
MQITFTLSPSYTGATYVAGPFNISGTTSAGTSYWLATGVTKSQLTTGYTINTTYETLTGGTIASTGTCSTTQPWYVTAPSPTPTPTATDSGEALTAIGLQGPYGNCNNACAAYNSNPSYTQFYMTTSDFNSLSSLNGTLYTTSTANPSYYVNSGWYYHSSGYMIQVGSNGVVDATIFQCQIGGTCGNGVIN